MSEMAARVARAIAEIYDGYADPVETPANWCRAICAARAASEAMREPTEAMAAVTTDYRLGMGEAKGIWRTMIDEALR